MIETETKRERELDILTNSVFSDLLMDAHKFIQNPLVTEQQLNWEFLNLKLIYCAATDSLDKDLVE